MSLLRLATLPPLLSPQTDGLDAGRSGRWDGFLVSDRCCAFLVATSWSEGTRRRTAQTRRFLPREFWAKLRSLLPSQPRRVVGRALVTVACTSVFVSSSCPDVSKTRTQTRPPLTTVSTGQSRPRTITDAATAMEAARGTGMSLNPNTMFGGTRRLWGAQYSPRRVEAFHDTSRGAEGGHAWKKSRRVRLEFVLPLLRKEVWRSREEGILG